MSGLEQTFDNNSRSINKCNFHRSTTMKSWFSAITSFQAQAATNLLLDQVSYSSRLNPWNTGHSAYLDLALIFLLFLFSLLILFFLHLALIALKHLSCRSESSNKSLVVIFFLMLFLLGLDSEFALFETVLVAIYDTFPSLRKQKVGVTSAMCFLCFLLGLPCITQSGQYVLDLMDTYGASISVMVIAVAEMIAVMWGYGANNFCKDLQSMLGFYPGLYFKVCWVIISPLLLIVILVAVIIDWTKPSYGSLPYPEWAHGVGFTLTVISVIQIPLWFFITIVMYFTNLFGYESFPFSCTKAWFERRREEPCALVRNVSFLNLNDDFSGGRTRSKVSMLNYFDSSDNSTSTKKNLTVSTTTSSIGSYVGTMQPEPGLDRESKTMI